MTFMKRTWWYLNRISYISLADLLYRIRWKLKQKFHYSKIAGNDNVPYSDEDIWDILIKFKKNRYLKFPFDKDKTRKSYLEFFSKRKIIREADAYLNHNFSFYDMKNIYLGKEINWNKDYKTNKEWPFVFHGSIDHNSTEFGDVKYIWELNRHQHFYVLGKAYYLSKKEKYAKEIIDEIESWISQNNYLIGINWFSSLECSLRVLSWLWALQFIKDSRALSKEKFEKILRYIYLQEDFVYNNLSLYSSANNHLIGETAVLFVVSKAFPFFKDAKKWNIPKDMSSGIYTMIILKAIQLGCSELVGD